MGNVLRGIKELLKNQANENAPREDLVGMIQPQYRGSRHIMALAFAAMLLVLIIISFLTFSYGAYMVFNQPISNVVSETGLTRTGSHYLYVYGTGFQSDSQKVIWVDPQFSPTNSSLINPNSGTIIGYAATNASGFINQNFTLPVAKLQQISGDGQQVHYVWVIGNQTKITNPTDQYSQVITIDSQENYTASTRGSGIILFATLITFVVPINFNLGQLFIFLWIVYALMFAVALNGPLRSILGAMREAASKGVGAVFDNSLFAMFAIFPVVLWGTILLELVQAASGVSTGQLPTTDPLLQYVELTIAPLREEIGFRVIPIGVVTFLIIVSKGRWKDGIMALWHPSKYLKKVDSPIQYKQHLPIMYLLIAISATIFGLAHVLLGAGWGIGKISEAAGAGVALGALYYKYGLPSAVLLHWSIDVALQTVAINNTLAPYADLVIIYTGVVAVASTLVLLILFARRLRRRPSLGAYPTFSQQ